jgi:hypothetical protein
MPHRYVGDREKIPPPVPDPDPRGGIRLDPNLGSGSDGKHDADSARTPSARIR